MKIASVTYGTTKKHNSGRKKRRWPKPLQRSAKYKHDVVLAETRNDTPDQEPNEAGYKHEMASKHIREAPEWEEKCASHQ
jgi:hypothetical protein